MRALALASNYSRETICRSIVMVKQVYEVTCVLGSAQDLIWPLHYGIVRR